MGALASYVQRFVELNGRPLARALRGLAAQLEYITPGPPAVGAVVFIAEGVPSMGQIVGKDTDPPFSGAALFADAKGSPTSADTQPTWAVEDESVCTAEVSDDGTEATFTWGSPGDQAAKTTQITCTTTDNDGTEVVLVGAATVTSGEAVTGEITFTPGTTTG